MKLPKHYTVKQCLDALDGLIEVDNDIENEELRNKGFCVTYRQGYEMDKKSKHIALSKYPLDALVQLNVEETNEMFGETK